MVTSRRAFLKKSLLLGASLFLPPASAYSLGSRSPSPEEITKQQIALLEKKSGCPVHVMEDADLSTMSAIKIARGNLAAHIISYKPGLKTESPDYSIIFQCALALRSGQRQS